jgi:hypothetical protein
MTWQAYHIVFRLRSPMHIGSGSVGNIQRTRPYIIGRAFWGALTMRITRECQTTQSLSTNDYSKIGEEVHKNIAYTYFYPAILTNGNYQTLWPWEKPDRFKHRLIRSYASTALDYPMQSAAEALLHESEFISPYTLDTAEPVFMTGYIFVNDQCNIDLESALQRLQFGGDRCYGWGDVKLVRCEPPDNNVLFGGMATFHSNKERPVISLNDQLSLLAHTMSKSVEADGDIEPLVGREWRKNGQAGQHVEFTGICFIPGSTLKQPADFTIGNFGVWQIIKQ